MSGDHFGTMLTLTTFGESHGPSIGAVLGGCPAGLALSEADIQGDCDRRRPGRSRYTSGRREDDQIQIVSGVYEGKTTGAPIGLMMKNIDAKSKDYTAIADILRPGHGDWSYWKKYAHRDPRGGGRSSARETAMRVAAGVIAKKFLKEACGTQIWAYVAQIGPIKPRVIRREDIESSPFFFPDRDMWPELDQLIALLRRQGDSVGARVNVVADHVPAGLGEPMYGRLDADLAQAMMSIHACKAVSIGDGFDVVTQHGSEHRDEITPEGFLSNHAGGILGGISTGQSILVSTAFKPTSSIRLTGRTLNHAGEAVELSVKGRHDPCVGMRAVAVVEAMMALTLMDHYLRQRACHPVQLEAAVAALHAKDSAPNLPA